MCFELFYFLLYSVHYWNSLGYRYRRIFTVYLFIWLSLAAAFWMFHAKITFSHAGLLGSFRCTSLHCDRIFFRSSRTTESIQVTKFRRLSSSSVHSPRTCGMIQGIGVRHLGASVVSMPLLLLWNQLTTGNIHRHRDARYCSVAFCIAHMSALSQVAVVSLSDTIWSVISFVENLRPTGCQLVVV